MEKFEQEEIETYGTTESRPKRARKLHNYKHLNDGAPPLMDMNYEESFLNDNKSPKVEPKSIKTLTIVEAEEEEEGEGDSIKSLKLKCLICYKSFKHRAAFSVRNNFSTNYCNKVFSTFCNLLLHVQQDQNSPISWDFELHPLPFCSECAKDVIGLVKLQQLIESYQKSVSEVVYDIKAQILETEAEIPSLELLDDDDDDILNRYKDRIKSMRTTAISDFVPSKFSKPTKLKTPTKQHKTSSPRNYRLKRGKKFGSLEDINDYEDFAASDEEENVTESSLNPKVVLIKIEPAIFPPDADSPINLGPEEKPPLIKKSSAFRRKNRGAASGIKREPKHDVEEVGEDGTSINRPPDPDWTQPDDSDVLHRPVSKNFHNKEVLSGISTKPLKRKRYVSKKPTTTKKRIPFITTKDGTLLFGNIEVLKVKIANESKYQCSLCGSYNKELYAIKRHIKLAHINRDNTASKEATCTICGKELKNIESMSRHNKIYHSIQPRKKYQCELCGKSFNEYRSIGRHKIQFHQVPVEELKDQTFFTCDICSRPFIDKKSMKIHRLTHMTDEEKYEEMAKLKEEDVAQILYQCSYCGKSVNCPANLKIHEAIHKDERPFTCDVCGASFRNKIILRDHILTHKDKEEWKYGCDYPGCGMRFIQKRQLDEHSYRHRPDTDKPFECVVCETRFARKASLAMHQRQHTGERPCVCAICNKSFTRPNHVRRHYKNIHQLTPEQMPPINHTYINSFIITNIMSVGSGDGDDTSSKNLKYETS